MHTPLNLYTKSSRGVQSVSKLVFTFRKERRIGYNYLCQLCIFLLLSLKLWVFVKFMRTR